MTEPSIINGSRHPVISTGWLVTIVMLLIVVVDQAVKFYVKTHFYMGEAYEVFPWFQIKFIENNGMAFGMELFNKFILTFGRIAAVVFFIWFIKKSLSLVGIRKGFYIA